MVIFGGFGFAYLPRQGITAHYTCFMKEKGKIGGILPPYLIFSITTVNLKLRKCSVNT